MSSSKRRRKRNRQREKERSRFTSDLLNGLDRPRMSEPNPRNTDDAYDVDECFGGASNPRVTAGGSSTHRGRGGKFKGLSRDDTAHLKDHNDTQQFTQQNQNGVGKYSCFSSSYYIASYAVLYNMDVFHVLCRGFLR